MFSQRKKSQLGFMITIATATLVGCSSNLDSLGGLTSGVAAYIHMNESTHYESVDDSQMMINLGDIYLGEESSAWFGIQSVGNAPVQIQSMSLFSRGGMVGKSHG